MEMICLDTNILIVHKRAKQKNSTRLYLLSITYSFAVTTIQPMNYTVAIIAMKMLSGQTFSLK